MQLLSNHNPFMIKKTKKIFLPRWQRYFVLPFIGGVWTFVGYLEFFSAEAGELGVIGFVLLTLLFLGIGVMLWLMTSGRLPAYTMEEETEESPTETKL